MRAIKASKVNTAIDDEVLRTNIEKTLIDISVQYEHAQEVHHPARTGYYKVCILLAASVVEALVFELVKRDTFEDDNTVGAVTEYKVCQQLNQEFKYRDYTGRLLVCRKSQRKVNLNDNVSFDDLNKYCKDNELISVSEFRKIDRVRKLRNRIHLQSLSGRDIGYTKRKLDEAAYAVVVLLTKLSI